MRRNRMPRFSGSYRRMMREKMHATTQVNEQAEAPEQPETTDRTEQPEAVATEQEK